MGGGGSGATRAAEQAERERQAQIASGTAAVNRVFDAPSRQAQVSDFVNAIRQNFMLDANRQKDVADRRLRFALARGGLTGGSTDVDSRRRLGEEHIQGLLGLENRAQAAGADLQGRDEEARLQLLSMVQGGLDTTTAAQRAGAAIRTSADAAKGRATAGGLGDLFGNTADLYRRQEEGAERRRGAREALISIYGKPFGG